MKQKKKKLINKLKYSNAGKGDKFRRGISPIEWAKRWDKIFGGKKSRIKKSEK